jgi:hypothetical protein
MRLYRAVSQVELDDLQQFGGFRPRPEGGTMEAKLFATSEEDARWWGQQLHGAAGDPFLVMEAEVPDALAGRLYRSEVDRGRPYVAVYKEELAEFNAAARIRVVSYHGEQGHA